MPVKSSYLWLCLRKAVLGLFGLQLTLACTTIPEGRSAVAEFSLVGNDTISASDIEAQLATKQTPRFIGLVRGLIYDYELFNYEVLRVDLQRIERYYRTQGYYAARVIAGRVLQVTPDKVNVEIVITEGPQCRLAHIYYHGLEGTERPTVDAAIQAFESDLKRGNPLKEDEIAKARNALLDTLTNQGYGRAKAESEVFVDLAKQEATIHVRVKPGRIASFGELTIEGLASLPEEPVRRAIGLSPGAKFSPKLLKEAEQAVMDLGVFSDARISADFDAQDAEGRVPVVAKLRVSELRTLSLGAGIQLDVLRSDAHALIAWEHRNFLGGFRKFTFSTRPGAVLYPTRVPNFQRPERVLPEVKNTLRLEQAGFIEPRTHGVVNVNYDVYPLLLETKVPRGAPVVGFHELKATTGVDRRIQRFIGDLSYNFQANVPFTYRGPLTDNVVPLYLSFLELKTALDFRNDRIRPTEGAYLTATTQFAGLGGDARDLRIVPTANFYIPLKPKRLGLALRAQIGMLQPFNYRVTAETSEVSVKEAQIAYFRALFSGGPTSNRGYPVRGVGPAGSLPFFSPGVEQRLGRGACDSAAPDYDPALCQTPVGGQSLWEASVELRLSIVGAFSAAFFCDTSDVGRSRFEFNFTRLHLSCGLGPRYDTPVGPIRLDVAYRIPGLQTIGDPGRVELDPGNLLGLPINLALGFGEVF